MKSFLNWPCFLLAALLAVMTAQLSCTDFQAAAWERRAESVDRLEDLNRDIVRSYNFSQLALEATRMLAVENGLLCEREAKLTQVVAGVEEENRSLKSSLDESVSRLQTQVEEINRLIDENTRLSWKVLCLESALEAVNRIVEKDEVEEKEEVTDEVQ